MREESQGWRCPQLLTRAYSVLSPLYTCAQGTKVALRRHSHCRNLLRKLQRLRLVSKWWMQASPAGMSDTRETQLSGQRFRDREIKKEPESKRERGGGSAGHCIAAVHLGPWGRGGRERARCWKPDPSLEPPSPDLQGTLSLLHLLWGPAGTPSRAPSSQTPLPYMFEREKAPGLATLNSCSGHLQSPRGFQGADLIKGHRS